MFKEKIYRLCGMVHAYDLSSGDAEAGGSLNWTSLGSIESFRTVRTAEATLKSCLH